MSAPRIDQPFVKTVLETAIGVVPVVSSSLTVHDLLGRVKVRCGIGRDNYKVDPGLYAVGTPDANSEILVTSNYKLTFDALRNSVGHKSAWTLVLDTDGVNVWCAAGKGTFGTAELVRRIVSSRLHVLVKHRRLIVPQLGAPGISAHEVKKESGFRVVFGPVDCSDVVEFLDHGNVATREMRFKSFRLADRAALIPVELVHALKQGLLISILVAIMSGLFGSNSFWNNVMDHGLLFTIGLFGGILGGAVITPLLLPWLPGRSFSGKGALIGLLMASISMPLWFAGLDNNWSLFDFLCLAGITASVASYLSLNFTGSSTFTSLSGVRKEMKWAVPLQLSVAITGLSAWIVDIILK